MVCFRGFFIKRALAERSSAPGAVKRPPSRMALALSPVGPDGGPANEADRKRRSEDQHQDFYPSGKGLEANPDGDADQSCGAEKDRHRAQRERSLSPSTQTPVRG
jgi:hypothetical protein